VHDYRRIAQSVSGNRGYHHLHQNHSTDGTVAADTKAKLIYGSSAGAPQVD